jgi:hypothetical protein
MTGTRARLVLLALVVLCGGVITGSVSAAPLTVGNVLAGTGGGTIKEFTPAGALVQTLVTDPGTTYDTGMCFKSNGHLLATNFSGAVGMSEFDNTTGALIPGGFGSGFNASPESCAVDSSGNVYVGQADGSADVLKFSSAGAPLGSFNVGTGDRGSDWIDLAADQHTLFYSSEGGDIFRYDLATSTQLPLFSTVPNEPCYALRIRPNGEVLVACTSVVFRLSAAGTLLQTYTLGAGGLFALNLDPDNTSFWTADFNNGMIYHVDIASGATLGSFSSSPINGPFGLAVVGEIRVAQRPPTCLLTATISGPPKQIQITTQAAGGLAAIVVTDTTNAVTTVPPFTPGTTNPVVITSTKITQAAGAHVALQVTAVSGGTTTCDPVLPGKAGHAQPLKLVFQHALGVLGQLGRLVRL